MSPEQSSRDAVRLKHAAFAIRAMAALVDFTILLIPFSVIVSFAAVGMNIWYNFFFYFRSGQPLPEDLARKGPTLVFIGLAAFVLSGWIYFALLESSSWRGTLGKHVFGLYVGDERGERINFSQATLRFAGGRLLWHLPWIGLFYLLVDCSCAAVPPRNRAIHDILAGCLVLQESAEVRNISASSKAN